MQHELANNSSLDLCIPVKQLTDMCNQSHHIGILQMHLFGAHHHKVGDKTDFWTIMKERISKFNRGQKNLSWWMEIAHCEKDELDLCSDIEMHLVKLKYKIHYTALEVDQ